MAGYQDNPQTFGNFNPYIQQLPMSQMAEIGMRKQAQYNEGVQRIQTQIDNIAGLDVIRDVDKQYLQSKLNELGNNLKTVAASDFSNFQLVNSTGGMVKSIANDKVILDKVSDTMKYRKDLERIQNDVKEGKDNPANTFRFNKQANNWMQGDISTSYSGRYVTPRDVWKKIKDVAASIGMSSEDIENVFQTDEKGNPLTEKIKDKNGKVIGEKPIFNDVAVTKMTKGKDPSVVYKAFQTALTPDDFEQLAIDGEYRYANLSPEELKQDIITQSQSQISDMDSKLTSVRLLLEAKRSNAKEDPEEIAKLEKLEQIYKQSKLSYEQTRERNLNDVDVNPDRVRGSLYTNTYLHTMAEALSPHEVSIKYSITPQFEVDLKLKEFAERKRATAFDEQMKRRQDARAQGQYEMDVIKFNERDAVTKPTRGINDPLEGITNDKLAAVNEDAAVAKIDEKNALAEKIAFSAMRGEYGDLSDEELRKIMDRESINSPGDNFADKRQNYINSKVAAQIKAWEDNKVPMGEEDLYRQYKNAEREAVASQEYVDSVDKEAFKIAKERGINVKTQEEVKSQIKPFSIKITDPTSVTGWKMTPLSTEDILDFARNDDKSKENLIRKYGKKGYEERWEALHLPAYNMYDPIKRDVPELIEVKRLLAENEYKKLNEIKGEIYKQRGIVDIPQSYTLENKGKAKDDISNIISTNTTNKMPEYNQQEMLKAVASEQSTFSLVAGKETDETPFYKLKVKDKDGRSKEMFITEQEFKSTGLIPERSTTLSAVERKLAVPENRSTGENNYSGAFFKGDLDFPNFKSEQYNIAGNFIKTSSDDNTVVLRVYLKDKKTNREFPVDLVKTQILVDDGTGNLRRNLSLSTLTELVTEAEIKKAINR